MTEPEQNHGAQTLEMLINEGPQVGPALANMVP